MNVVLVRCPWCRRPFTPDVYADHVEGCTRRTDDPSITPDAWRKLT